MYTIQFKEPVQYLTVYNMQSITLLLSPFFHHPNVMQTYRETNNQSHVMYLATGIVTLSFQQQHKEGQSWTFLSRSVRH